MILTECAVFAAMFAAGGAAAMIASALLALGVASRVARAVFDFLTPLVVGAVFFFSLYFSSGGVFRLYALGAFLLGGVLARLLLKKFSPWLRRLLARALVPIKSLEMAVEKLFRPIAECLARQKEKRREARRVMAEKRAQKRRENACFRAQKQEEKRRKQKILAYRKSRSSRDSERQRRPARARPIGQSD